MLEPRLFSRSRGRFAAAALLLLTGCQTPRAMSVRSTPPAGTVAEGVVERESREQAIEESSSEQPAAELATAGLEPPKSDSSIEPVAGEFITNYQELTLPELETMALQHNPAIKQAAAAAVKAMGFRDQVGRYPNPNVGYQGSQLADRGTDQHVAFLEQDIILGKKLERNRLVLEQDVQAQLWEVEVTRQRVLTDVRTRFYEALAAQKRISLSTDFGETTRKGIEAAELRLKALEGSRTELLQAEVQNTEVTLFRRRSELAFRGIWTELLAIAGCPGATGTRIVGSLKLDLMARDWEATYCQIEEMSPELRANCSRIARATANLDRQRVQPIPNLSFMVAAGRDNGTDSGMMNTQIGVPVPIFNRNAGNTEAAWAEYCRATQAHERIKLSLRARLARVAQDYDSAAIQVQTYEEEIVPKADKALDLAEQAYRAGEVDFAQLLLVRRTFFDANLAYIAAMSEFASASVQIDGLLLSGGLLETPDTTADDGLRGQTLSGQ